MITIFTIPKPFVGLDDIHQRNAIQSWLAIRPECEIILCGNDQGVAEVAKEYGVVHIPDIPVNEFGTPYLNHAFERAQEIAKHDLMCYVNADIIFPPSLVESISSIPFQKFLGVGRRFNLDVDCLVDFQDQRSSQQFFDFANLQASEFIMGASDYFFFRKNGFTDLPPFAVGRPYWDNWMMYSARMLRLPLIDVTLPILSVHQNHDHFHVQQIRKGPYYGPEGDRNLEYLGIENAFALYDATHFLDSNNTIHKVRGDEYLKRKIRTMPILKPRTGLRQKWQAFVQKFLMFLYFRREKIPYRVFESSVNFLDKLS